MSDNQINSLCHLLGLGQLRQPPVLVEGGLLHTMWRLVTEKGSFALKELSPRIDLTNDSIIQNYNLTEHIAWQFTQHGIPAVGAIGKKGHYLTLYNGKGFLAYQWVQAKALEKDRVSPAHALKIAALLAKIHSLNLSVSELVAPIFDIHTNEAISALIVKAAKSQCSFAKQLKANEQDLLTCNEHYQQAIPLLKKQMVVSHGDLDQKNVLWDENDLPILIDWESARLINPTYEIVNASLDWSGITAHFDETLFNKMLQAYQQAGGLIHQSLFAAALYGVLGNWINWLVYNIERACNPIDPAQKAMGCDQVIMVLPTILKVQQLIPKLMDVKNC